MKWLKGVSDALPLNIRDALKALTEEQLKNIEEIRIRIGKPLLFHLNQQDFFLSREGKLTEKISEAYRVTEEDISKTLQLVSNCSLYAIEEELKNGFITIPGGHRVGITGKVVMDEGKVKTMKYLTGFNFRVCKEFPGSANKVMPYIIASPNKVKHTLIISPPCCGKTTLLRDIIRQISEGVPLFRFRGLTVGVVDERSEIAGCHQGIPQMDVGIRTDVLDGCPKAEGMIMLVRSMGPKVIATDEIGKQADIAALQEVINAGIKIIATIHGENIGDLIKRPGLKYLLEQKIFERFIILGRSKGVGTIEQVLDGSDEKNLLRKVN